MQEDQSTGNDLPLKKPKKDSSFLSKLTIALVFLVFLLTLISGVFFFFWAQIENEFTVGTGKLQVYQAKILNPSHYSADSIVYKDSTQKLTLTSVHLDLDPFAFSEGNISFLKLQADSITFQQKSSPIKKKVLPTEKKRLVFKNFQLPFKFDIQVKYFQHKLDSNITTKVRDFSLFNQHSQSLNVQAKQVSSQEITSIPSLDLEVDWTQTQTVDVDILIKAQKDSAQIKAVVQKDNLERFHSKVNISLQTLFPWLPKPIAQELHFIDKIQVNGEVDIDLLNEEYSHNLKAKSHLKSVYDFPALNIDIASSGSLNDFTWSLAGKGYSQERLNFRGSTKDLKKLSFQGKTSGIYRQMTNSHVLPINFTVNSGSFEKEKLTANLTTQDQSNVSGVIDFSKKQIQGIFSADIDPKESWAIGWTEDHLQIDGASIEGRFKSGDLILKVNSSTPNAYGFAAEDVQTDMRIDGKGIYFWNGRIQQRGVPFNFTGKVLWDPANPHYSFNIQGNNNDFLKIYGDYESNLSVNSSKFDLKDLPLKDSVLLQYNPGKLTGNYQNNFHTKIGATSLFLESTIADEPINFDLQAAFIHDTLRIQSANIAYNQSTLHTQGDFHFNHSINDSSFYPYSFEIQTDSFDLVDFSKGFLDGQIQSGIIDGDISYNGKRLLGKLTASDVYFKDIDSAQFYIPSMSLQGLNSGISLLGTSEWGEAGEWDGIFHLYLDKMLEPQKEIHFSYVPDRNLLFNQDGITQFSEESYFQLRSTTSNFHQFQGEAQANGSWNLPNHIGQLTDLKFYTPFQWNQKLGFKGLNLNTQVFQAVYHHDDIPQTKINLDANIAGGQIKANATILDSLNQRATLLTHYDVNYNKLRRFDFNAPKFFFPLDSIQRLNFVDLKGYLKETDNFVNIHFSSPTTFYQMKDSELGEINARLMNINGFYSLPIETDSKRTYKTRINGEAEIASLLFEKNDFNDKYIDVGLSFFSNKKRVRSTLNKIEKKPIELNIDVRDAGYDSLRVKTNLAEFPITTILQISGTTSNPILSGTVQSTSTGELKFEDYSFDIVNMGINWDRQKPKEGILDVKLFKELPFCVKPQDELEETCPIDIQVNGNVDDPRLTANANCGTNAEINTKQLFSSISLGCVSEQDGDVVVFIGNLIDRTISQQVKNLSNTYIRDDLIEDLQIHRAADAAELDSSSVYLETKIPGLETNNFFKDFRLKGQYVWDAQTDGDYERYQLVGLDYIFFDRINTQTGEFKDGKLTLGGNFVNKEYLESEDAQKNEQRLEWNVGTEYQNYFWGDFCLFGHGDCSPPIDPETGDELK